MSYRKSTLNLQSIAYNAATNTPALSGMVDGGIYTVNTAGILTGITVAGATTGSDSCLLVGDKILCSNGSYSLLIPDIAVNTDITIGTGGLFSTLYAATTYIKQRCYVNLTLTLLSNTVETQSTIFENPCCGDLLLDCAGFTLNYSATLNASLSINAINVTLNNFRVIANCTTVPCVTISGVVYHDNGVTIQNTATTGSNVALLVSNATFQNAGGAASIPATANISITVTSVARAAYAIYRSTTACNNLTSTGVTEMGRMSINEISGNLLTSGGTLNLGSAGTLNLIRGSIATSGGALDTGVTTSNYIGNGLGTSNITTSGGSFSCGVLCQNEFLSSINSGAGAINFGSVSTSNFAYAFTGTGTVNAGGGSTNNCNNQSMPAGTPASGTITAAFRRIN